MALGLLVLSTMAVAQTEYNDLGHRVLNNEQDTCKYYLAARSNRPARAELSEVGTATKAAFQAWEDVVCVWPAFQFVSRATNGSPMPNAADPADRFTVAPIWVTEGQDACYRDTLSGGDLSANVSPQGERACATAHGLVHRAEPCSAVEDGAACLATCRSNQDCSPNMLCGSGGTCYAPSACPDAGMCALCHDAGTPPPVPTDGGAEGAVGGPGGCGCQGAPSTAAFLAGLVVLPVTGRRRAWHRL